MRLLQRLVNMDWGLGAGGGGGAKKKKKKKNPLV